MARPDDWLKRSFSHASVALEINSRTKISLSDRKSTRLNSSHTEIYTLSLHDALPICDVRLVNGPPRRLVEAQLLARIRRVGNQLAHEDFFVRSEEHTSELQSHRDLHSFPTRRSSDLRRPVGKWPAPTIG